MTHQPIWTNKAALRGLLALVMIAVFMWKGCPSDATSGTPTLASPKQVLFATPADSSVACFRIPALEQIDGVLLAAIDERWPSREAYLADTLGFGPDRVAQLRAELLE